MADDPRKIIHVDMDAFYAAIEQRDQPHLRRKPVVVGGRPDSRGVVATCSYEARQFGIHSAMSCARAYRLCPEVIFVRPRFDVYRCVSQQIREIFLRYTDLVEPLSLDEAYLDVTHNKKSIRSATWVAQNILKEISRETSLTASAGVSYNKFIAKIASDVNKPEGLTVVTPEQAEAFIAELPIRKFHGVGRVTEKRMHRLGIITGNELRRYSLEELTRWFGKSGKYFFDIARGIDLRPVTPNRLRKSIGKETTLKEDIADVGQMLTVIGDLAEKVSCLLKQKQTSGLTLTLKVKYADFQIVTRSISQEQVIEKADDILMLAEQLLKRTDAGKRAVRLLGITISHLTTEVPVSDSLQMDLPLG